MIFLIGVLFFFLLTLVPYSVYNSGQLHYFLYSLHQVDPELFAKDWLVTQTVNIHLFFSTFIAWLMRAGDLAAGLFVVRILQLLFLVIGLLRLCRTLTKDWRVGPLVFVFLLFYFSDGLGQETLYSAIVQPADLGKLFYLFSLISLLEEKWISTGTLLGLTGLFDFLSGVEGALIAFIFWIFQERKRPLKEAALSLFLFLLLASPNLFSLFQNFSPFGSLPEGDFQKLFFNFRGPHHYRFANFEIAHVARVLFPLYFLFFVPKLFRKEMETRIRFYTTVLLSLAVLAIISIEWVYWPTVVQFRFLRLSPFLLILGLVALAASLLREAESGKPEKFLLAGLTITVLFLEKDARLFIPLSFALILLRQFRSKAVLAGGFVFIGLIYLLRGRGWELGLDVLLAAFLVFLLRKKPARPVIQAGWAFVLLGVPAVVFHLIFPERVSFHPIQVSPPSPIFQSNIPLKEALEWIRENTPMDAVLLTPPNQDGIRFFTERAIVVDFHANPYRPKEVWEWKERLEAVSGSTGLEKWNPSGGNTNAQREFLRKGYLNLSLDEVEKMAKRFGADYFLTEAGYQGKEAFVKRGHRLVFENPKYLVFQI